MKSLFHVSHVRRASTLLSVVVLALVVAACVPSPGTDVGNPDVPATVRAELTRNAPPTPTPDLQATVNAELTRIAPSTTTPSSDSPVTDPSTDTPPPDSPVTVPPPTITSTTVPPEVTIPYGIVTASRGINVRSGPDTEYPLLRVIADGTRLEVIGRSLNNEWWQVRVSDLPGGTGWVSTIYMQTYNTNGVAVAQAPPLPSTITPSPTWTPVPPVVNPPSAVGLNPNNSANFGAHSLSAGFLPDPWSAGVTSGGSVDVYGESIASGCTGYASTSPDVILNWNGSGGLLRIYFEADSSSDDATLTIRTPGGAWYCDDDHEGSRNPLVQLDSATTGRYAIWIGSFHSDDYISGDLLITEYSSGGPVN